MKMKLSGLFLALTLSTNAHANPEEIGDVLQILIPATAYATTLYLDDDEGEIEFYKAYGSTLLSTYTLKYTVQEKRPDSDARNSFPSGHTASAFSGASFIHARYGFKYAIIPYLAATYTGYSRVESNRHYTHDVIAGAALASFCSWYFTSEYKNLTITPMVDADIKGVTLALKF